MTYCYTDANGIVHYRTISVPVSLVKPASIEDDFEVTFGRDARARIPQTRLARTYPADHPLGKINARVELLGNASFGKIVRPEVMRERDLKPLTVFYG